MGNSGAKPGKGDSPIDPSSSSSSPCITAPIRGGGSIRLGPGPAPVHCSYMPLQDAAGCLHTVVTPRRLSPPLAPIAPASDASAAPPSLMNLANTETGDIKQLEQEYPRRPGEPNCSYYVNFGNCGYGMSCRFNHPPKASGCGEIKQLEPEYPRRPGEPDCSYYVKFGRCGYGMSCRFNHPPKPPGCGEIKQLEPEYPRRPDEPDYSYYVKFGSCRYGMKCRFNSETGEIKQMEPEYPRRPGEPDCPMGDSSIAPSSHGSATPPSLMNLANSETGEIKQLEPEYPRRPGEPDFTMGDSPIAPSSDGSGTPPSSMNLANSETGMIKQLEPEYPRQPGEPDCPMGGSSSFSSLSITTPPSGKKRGIKKKSIPVPMGDPSSDGSAAPPANSETGEKQPEPEYPLRPGKRDCSYYVKFGSCRYGMNCWFNHPLYTPGQDNGGGRNSSSSGSRASNSSEHKQYFSGKACNYNRHEGKTKVKEVNLNFLGLPLRPGTLPCSYYMDRGTCKFGINCKFHHPDPESEHVNSNASQHAIQGSSQMNLSTKPVQRALNGQFVPLVTSPTSGTSEIIPTEGVNPCPEWSGYQMDQNKQGKPDWDPFTTKVFCDICTDEVLAGNRPTDHLNAIGYNNLCAKFNEKTKKGYNHEQFKSKWESLKKDYQTRKALMGSEDDLGQDPKMNTISASLEWWAKKMEVMPDCGKFCFAPLENVNLLNIMFEDMVDSSSKSAEANLAVNTTIESEQGAGDGNDIGIIDKYVNGQSKEAMLPKSSNKEPNSAKLKINCVHAELNDLVNFDENVNPSNLATSMRIDRVGSNISEIMELVVDAGAEEGSDEHFIATQLFIRPEHREMFLTLKTPRGRLGWLKKMCQVKELL